MDKLVAALRNVSPHDWVFSVAIPVGIGLVFLLIQWFGPPSWTMFAGGYRRARLKNVEAKLRLVETVKTDPDKARAATTLYVVRIVTSIALQATGIGLFVFSKDDPGDWVAEGYRFFAGAVWAVGTSRALGLSAWATLAARAAIRPDKITAELTAARDRLSKAPA